MDRETIPRSSEFGKALEKAKLYHRSCIVDSDSNLSGSNGGGTGCKFESVLLACTSDDQKEISIR